MEWFDERTYMNEKRVHVDQLVIRSGYRRKRIEKNFMTELERRALARGIQVINLFVSERNPRALEFYEKKVFATDRRHLMNKLRANDYGKTAHEICG